METYKIIYCNMTGCEFWCNCECLYVGTTKVTPNGVCDAYEPVEDRIEKSDKSNIL